MSKQNLMSVFNDLETLFSHPGVLGFNPLVNELRTAVSANTNYPPRNIIQTDENSWMLEVAVAGFGPRDISVTVENGHLHVSGKSSLVDDSQIDYVHHGMARRSFSFKIRLGEHVRVCEDAPPFMQHGMLIINLEREIPEAEKPKTYEVISVDQIRDDIIEDQPEDS